MDGLGAFLQKLFNTYDHTSAEVGVSDNAATCCLIAGLLNCSGLFQKSAPTNPNGEQRQRKGRTIETDHDKDAKQCFFQTVASTNEES